MPLSNSQYDVISRIYGEKQNKNRHTQEQRLAYVYENVVGFQNLDSSIATISIQQGKKLLSGEDSALSDLKHQLEKLSSEKKRLLAANNLAQDYLEPIYDCRDCNDTGYLNGHKCHCFRSMEIALLYEQSNIRQLLEVENFSTLSCEYYQGDDLQRFSKASDTCKKFVENFNFSYQNLFFYGTVGTGKSFLSGCIAKELIDRGHSVIYFSASALFDTLSQYSFDYKSKEELHSVHEDIYHCDLLIIDDLGTELTNSFVSSQLFSCLNERHIRQKAVIISTNLSLEELRNRYSDRIFSRITSQYELLKLSGQDIRLYKKRNNR